MLKKKLSVYSHMAQKKLKGQLKKMGVGAQRQIHKLGTEHDSHIVDDMSLTLSRGTSAGAREQEEVIQ